MNADEPTFLPQPDDGLGAALRRDLQARLVPYDERRAEEMITQATQAQLRSTRTWQAPLAAAAAVVVVGGGAAALAANHGGGDQSAGPGSACGDAPSAIASVSGSSLPSNDYDATDSAVPSSPIVFSVPVTTASSGPRLPPKIYAATPASSEIHFTLVPSRLRINVDPSNDASVGPGTAPPTTAPVDPTGSAVPCDTASPATSSAPASRAPASTSAAPPPSSTPTAPAPSTTPASSASESESESNSASASPGRTTPAYRPPQPPPSRAPQPGSTSTSMPQLLQLSAAPHGRVTVVGPLIPRGTELVVTGVMNVSSRGSSTVVLRRGDGPALLHLSVDENGYTESGDPSGVYTRANPLTATLTCTGTSSCGQTLKVVGHFRTT